MFSLNIVYPYNPLYLTENYFLKSAKSLLLYFRKEFINRFTLIHIGPVAQLDRAFDYESKGRAFESLRVRHYPYNMLFSLCCMLNFALLIP